MIVIVDYGLGNLRSVAGAVQKTGHEAVVSGRPEDVLRAEKLILPGVGAFGDGMKNLHERGLVAALDQRVRRDGVPILGICLGSQLMAQESEEFGRHEGLGWFDARVARLETNGSGLRVPHVGWDDLLRTQDDPLYAGIPADALFYYVHSFYIDCRTPEAVIGECQYGPRFAAALRQGNIVATQFHPEKSQAHGLTMLGNFLRS